MAKAYFTDSEYRILLAAIGREEKVCQKVDMEHEGSSNLTAIILSIERKVYALQHPDEILDIDDEVRT